MRKFSLYLVGGALLLTSVTLVEGQQGRKGGGGGFGMFGGQDNPYSLVLRADVKKELDVTEDQVEKLPAEVLLAIGKVLNEKQFKRFKQIDLQKRGNNAFKDPTVQSSLKLNGEQKKNLTSIVEDANKELIEARKGAFGGGGGAGGFKALQEKQATITKESKEKIYMVLTKEQRKAWRELVGEEFKFETQGGGFGNFKKKKTANE